MINNVVLVGRLTKDIDLRYTNNGTAVGSFTLAVNERFKSKNGEDKTNFINCLLWRKPAENLAKFTHKGSLIGVEGRLQTRNYQNRNGQTVYVTEVLVESFSLLEKRESAQTTQPNEPQQFITEKQAFEDYGDVINISDEDIPF